MTFEGQPEETSETGKPMVRATPRDVVHIRLGSFALIAIIAIGVLGLVAGLKWLMIAMAVLAVIAIVDIALALHRQSRTPGDTTTEAG
ncbi:hypothetical protein ACFV0L_02950 [Streptosporangium canum]|uniref:Uncharacterized protein n=1 Tax=Streptosporangium canum TaxID=324952 RepID=A0A1I3K980_9ACTN|nr:hypothetical protein [Streptosporangium canum]SFI69052.1 hypothetical protein SAMN05216275_104277 [Streptosporangium canum]